MTPNVEILMVDDDEMTLFIHEKILSRSALTFPFRSFRSAEQCLEFLEQNDASERSYLVLLDINMPGMGGWAMLDELKDRELKSNYKVIMATSSVDYDDRRKAEQYDDVIDFFEKPLSIAKCEVLAQHPQIMKLS